MYDKNSNFISQTKHKSDNFSEYVIDRKAKSVKNATMVRCRKLWKLIAWKIIGEIKKKIVDFVRASV